MPGGTNIGVVIAGDHGDPIRRADALEPRPRGREFCFQREVDEIAGDCDVIRRLRLHVRHKRIEHVAAMEFVAVANPIEIAKGALAGEVAQPRHGQRSQVRIGQVRQRECCHHRHPLLLPVR